ncbi:cellulose binding domain-containing protein [Glycomyces tarimensis]
MSPRPRTVKAIVTAGAGMLLALSVAAPSGAEHPEPAPQGYAVEDIGEDSCTYFHTIGEIRWPATHPDEHDVAVAGWKAIAVPDVAPGFPNPCNPVINEPRQVEFTFSGSGLPLGEHIVPFPESDSGTDFEFTFAAATEVDTVTVAVCQQRRSDGSTWPGRCAEAQTITLDGAEPEDPYCRYSYSVNQWGSGYLAEIAITPLTTASSGWGIEVVLPEGGTVSALWNAEWTQSGSSISIANTEWNAAVNAGGTASMGFIGTGQAPSPEDVHVVVDGNACGR